MTIIDRRSGRFLPLGALVRRALAGRVDAAEVEAECEAQIAAIEAASLFGTSVMTRFCMAWAAAETVALSSAESLFQAAVVTGPAGNITGLTAFGSAPTCSRGQRVLGPRPREICVANFFPQREDCVHAQSEIFQEHHP